MGGELSHPAAPPLLRRLRRPGRTLVPLVPPRGETCAKPDPPVPVWRASSLQVSFFALTTARSFTSPSNPLPSLYCIACPVRVLLFGYRIFFDPRLPVALQFASRCVRDPLARRDLLLLFFIPSNRQAHRHG